MIRRPLFQISGFCTLSSAAGHSPTKTSERVLCSAWLYGLLLGGRISQRGSRSVLSRTGSGRAQRHSTWNGYFSAMPSVSHCFGRLMIRVSDLICIDQNRCTLAIAWSPSKTLLDNHLGSGHSSAFEFGKSAVSVRRGIRDPLDKKYRINHQKESPLTRYACN